MPEEIKITTPVIVKDIKVEFVFDIPVYGIVHKEVDFEGNSIITNGEIGFVEFLDISFSRGYFDFGKDYYIIYSYGTFKYCQIIKETEREIILK